MRGTDERDMREDFKVMTSVPYFDVSNPCVYRLVRAQMYSDYFLCCNFTLGNKLNLKMHCM